MKILIKLSLFDEPDGVTKIISQELIDILFTILLTETSKLNLTLTLRLLNNILASEEKYKEGVLRQDKLMDLLFSFSLDQSKDLLIVKESCYCIVSVLVNSSKVILMEFLRNGYFVNLFRILKIWNSEPEIVIPLVQGIEMVLGFGEDIKDEFSGINPVLSEIRDHIDYDEFFEFFKRNKIVERKMENLRTYLENIDKN